MKEFVDAFHLHVVSRIFPFVGDIPMAFVYLGWFIAGSAAVIGFVTFISMVWTYGERKIAGFIQQRYGPNRVGPYGMLQAVADGMKLMAKEDIIPDGANRTLFRMAPLMVFVGAFLPFAALPFGETIFVVSMAAGLFYILAFEAIEVVGIIMAGWAPNSKWSLYGGMRLAAQVIAYEVPMGLCILTVVALTGSLDFREIVAVQGGAFGVGNWLVWPWVSPFACLGFILFYVGGMAATKRAPFDLPEAESELVAGFHTEYTGMRFAFFFMAEYAAMYVICAIGAVCFLGGWHGPGRDWLAPSPGDPALHEVLASRMAADAANAVWLSGANLLAVLSALGSWDFWKPVLYQLIGMAYLLLKAFVLLFVMVWVRWTLPRVRIDQVIHMCLKVLLPFSLLCALGAAAQQAFLGGNLLQWALGLFAG